MIKITLARSHATGRPRRWRWPTRRRPRCGSCLMPPRPSWMEMLGVGGVVHAEYDGQRRQAFAPFCHSSRGQPSFIGQRAAQRGAPRHAPAIARFASAWRGRPASSQAPKAAAMPNWAKRSIIERPTACRAPHPGRRPTRIPRREWTADAAGRRSAGSGWPTRRRSGGRRSRRDRRHKELTSPRPVIATRRWFMLSSSSGWRSGHPSAIPVRRRSGESSDR